MNYDLKRPCPNCPFRTDVEPYLRPERAEEIARSLAQGAGFPCHQTTVPDPDEGSERMATQESQFCAGALIALEKSETPNNLMRVAERVGLYDHAKLDMKSPVGTLVDFVDRHVGEPEGEPCGVADPGCEAPAGYMEGGIAIGSGETHYDTEACPNCGNYVCQSCECYCEGE